jgi:sulfatase modifying factor 1
VRLALALAVASAGIAGCRGGTGASASADAGASADARAGAGAGAGALADVGTSAGACPDDMVHVATDYCPSVARRCVDVEDDARNNIKICHAYAPSQQCRTREEPMAFCIDRYEYPDRKGAHPATMVSWYDAEATCETRGKRLCWASEWTAACEGPEHTPFPYGWVRDHDKCNVDNFYIDPGRSGAGRGPLLMYSRDGGVREAELARLDQSMPSGSLESCRSGFGVYDMTGNVDEWVTSDRPPREQSKWSGLKGGGWGHVRSQCRPMTASHDPSFFYYFVGFRCCMDAQGTTPWSPTPGTTPAPRVEPRDYASEEASYADAVGPSKTKYRRTGHVE